MAETWFFPDTVEYQCSSGYAAWKKVLSCCPFFNGDPCRKSHLPRKWSSMVIIGGKALQCLPMLAPSLQEACSWVIVKNTLRNLRLKLPCILCCIWRACDIYAISILCIRWSRCTLATLPLLCTRDLWKSHGATLRALVLEVDKKALLFTSHASQMPHPSDMRCQCVGMECWSWPQSLLRNPGMKLMETEPDSWQSMFPTKCHLMVLQRKDMLFFLAGSHWSPSTKWCSAGWNGRSGRMQVKPSRKESQSYAHEANWEINFGTICLIYLKKTPSPEQFLVFSFRCYNTGCLCKELREQCDDGNLDQDDGCDGQCHVESGFICVGGDRNQPDRPETEG